MQHESADLHVTGLALYTDDLVNRHLGVLHAYPVQAPHTHARGHVAAHRARAGGARRGPRAHRGRRARRERRGRQARRAAVPVRGLLPRARGVLGARRVAGGGADRRGPGRGRVRAAAVAGHGHRGDRGGELPGRAAHRAPRRAGGRSGTPAPTCSRASSSSPARSTSTWRRNAALAHVDENGQVFVQSSTQHPSETQEIVAHVLGLAQPRGHRAVPADGRRVRRQGDAAARLRRDRRARRHADRPPRAAAAQPHAGHDDDGQAARLPRGVEGRVRRRRQAPRAGRPRSPPTAAGASTCPSPCRPGRCATSTTPTGCRTSRCTGGSRRRTRRRRRRSAASAARRACS